MSDQVREVKAKSDIVAIISDYIILKKAGRNYKALCPFHSEKTPSFVVSSELQYFKCFGCGESGDVISFLEKYEGMDFYEALKFLADRSGIKLETLKFDQSGIKEKLYKINTLACAFYQYVLLSHNAGKKALAYLLGRGLKMDTIKTFRLGYSPDESFAIKKFLIDKKKIQLKEIESAGLIYKNYGKVFDRFRGRVVFPLFDHRGNIVGFAGRILPGPNASKLAKYINTPDTDIYHKSKVLYGLEIVKKDIKKAGFAVIVEGELDMISTWQAGIKNVVAIKGSALTQDQVKLLSRYTSELVLALDTDVAGDAAARRGIEIAEKEGLGIRVARLGKYKDPDEAAKDNPSFLRESIQNAIGVWDFTLGFIFSKYKGEGGEDKAKISREVVPILANISDRIVQSHYIQRVASRLKVSVDSVAQEVGKRIDKKEIVGSEIVVKEPEKKGRRELLEERLLMVAFRYNPTKLLSPKIHSLILSPLMKRIVDEFLVYTKKSKTFDPSIFASELPVELVNGFTDIVLKDVKGLGDEPEEYEKEIDMLVKELQIVGIKEELEKVSVRIKDFESKKEEVKLKKSKEKFDELIKKLSELEEAGFRGIIL